MSRIGRMPVKVPAGVTAVVKDGVITVKGPKGTLTQNIDRHMTVEVKDGEILVTRPDDSIRMKMLHGTTRALINNMVNGVVNGYVKELEIKGVGYRCEMQGTKLVLHIGHAAADVFEAPAGVTVSCKGLTVKVEGIDRQLVGQTAAEIRAMRKPEPYHGKGIRYKDEVVVLRTPSAKKKGAAAAGAAAK